MPRKIPAVAISAAAVALAGCGAARSTAASTTGTDAPVTTSAAPTVPTTTSPTTAGTSPTTASPASTSPTTASGTGGAGALPISVSTQLTSAQQDPSVLAPNACQLQGGVVTAQGSVNGTLPEVYIRYGDVVELYAYSTTDNPPNSANDVQVLDLGSETPGKLAGGTAWTASAPVAGGFPAPAQCFVAVQSTHAFMGAGNAGG